MDRSNCYAKYEKCECGTRIRIMKNGLTQYFIHEHDDDWEYQLGQIKVDDMEVAW